MSCERKNLNASSWLSAQYLTRVARYWIGSFQENRAESIAIAYLDEKTRDCQGITKLCNICGSARKHTMQPNQIREWRNMEKI